MGLGTALLMLASTGAALTQQLPISVEIKTEPTQIVHTVWYTEPVWLALGGVVLLLVVVLAVMATRNPQGKSTTTVLR
jgi:hypothetical protein